MKLLSTVVQPDGCSAYENELIFFIVVLYTCKEQRRLYICKEQNVYLEQRLVDFARAC